HQRWDKSPAGINIYSASRDLRDASGQIVCPCLYRVAGCARWRAREPVLWANRKSVRDWSLGRPGLRCAKKDLRDPAPPRGMWWFASRISSQPTCLLAHGREDICVGFWLQVTWVRPADSRIREVYSLRVRERLISASR